MTETANPKSEIQNPKLPRPVFEDGRHHIKMYQGDCLEILAAIPADCVDLIFADPPYFLSNDGITCHAGRMVSVNKGEWDRSRGPMLGFPYRPLIWFPTVVRFRANITIARIPM